MVVEVLTVDGVCKRFSRGDQWMDVLTDVSFEVGRGEIVAVVGRRLEGKTTVLRVAAGMESPDKGTVSLGDQELTARLLGREVVWVDRDGPALDAEVSVLVGGPLASQGCGRHEVQPMAAQMLERVGARECIGRRWGELLNWQRVLVGLARGFVGSPQLVVIDDLLDALDGRETEEASDLLRSLVEESEHRCGVLMSASDFESAIFADRVGSFARKGKLRLRGQPEGDARIIPFPKDAQADG
jgi:putative ABC transport system ATP-binding protein